VGGAIPDPASWTEAPPTTNPRVKEPVVNSRIGWGQPPPGWGQPFPGWAPLVDHGPRSLHAARSVARWWWPILTVGGFLAVVAQVLDHDHPAPGLSQRGLLTVALAAAVLALLTIHRRHGPKPLARAVAEYTVVALLAGLLATTGAMVDQPPADPATPHAQATAGDDQPTVIRAVTTVLRAGAKVVRGVTGAVRWLRDLWRQADQQTTPTGEAIAAPPPSPTPTAPSTWRSHP
jgi:hypothetical protein